MGYRAHVQTKHEIEYGNQYFNWAADRIELWLNENGVDICEYSGSECSNSAEWEIDKDSLRAIPEEAFCDLPRDGELDCVITAQDLRDFVKDCLAAPTGDYAYVSWF